MEKQNVIGVDFGTDSVRAVVIDGITGERLGTGICQYPRWKRGLYQDPEKKRFRQHPLDYLEGLEISVCEALDQAGGKARSQVLSISVDATGSTPCPVDRQGIPLSLLEPFKENENAMFHLWKDHTAINEAVELNQILSNDEGIDYTKYQGAYSSEWYWAKILYTSRIDAKVRASAFSWVEHCDWIPAVLTGNTNPLTMYRCSCAAGHKALWHSEWNGLPSRACFERVSSYLLPAYDSFSQKPRPADVKVGVITTDWARRLGLPSDTIIGGSSIDAHAGAVGAGIARNIFVTNVGTSTVDMMIEKADRLRGKNLVYASGQAEDSILPGYVGIEAGQAAFGDIYAWFAKFLMWPFSADLFGSSFFNESQKSFLFHEGKDKIIAALTEAATKLNVENSLIALDWFNGRRYPYTNENLKSAVYGLSLSSDAPLFFQSIVIATAFGLKKIVESWIREGLIIDQIIAVGGIAKKSSYVMQMMTDALACPIKVSATDQSCATGAAIYASVAGGLYPTIPEAQEKLCEGFIQEYFPDGSKTEALSVAYQKYEDLGAFVEKGF